jgi:hypothetical protein
VEPQREDATAGAAEASTPKGDPPAAVATAAAAPRVAVSRRQLTLIAAAVGAVALTGFAMSARGGSRSEAPATAKAPAPAAAAASAPAKGAPVATTITAVQAWSTDNQDAWLDNPRRGAAFEVRSENVVKTWFGAVRPSLVVRCVAQRIEAFVVTGSPLKIDPRVDGKTVTISLDGEPIRTEHWTDSDRHTAVFAADPAAFTSRLRTARMLHFGYSPHNSSDVVAQFHVAGLDALLGAAGKHCGGARR